MLTEIAEPLRWLTLANLVKVPEAGISKLEAVMILSFFLSVFLLFL